MFKDRGVPKGAPFFGHFFPWRVVPAISRQANADGTRRGCVTPLPARALFYGLIVCVRRSTRGVATRLTASTLCRSVRIAALHNV
jgi:hypothetical protein